MALVIILLFAAFLTGTGIAFALDLARGESESARSGPLRVGLGAALLLAGILVARLFAAGLSGEARVSGVWLFVVALATAFLVYRSARSGRFQSAGWRARLPGARTLAFFALVLAIFTAPVLVLPVPLDTDAQGFGYLALTLRQTGSLTTLAPFHPEIEYLYSPGFLTLAATLSATFGGAALHTVQFAAAAVLGWLFIWLLWDFGNEAGAWLAPIPPIRRDKKRSRFLSPTRGEESRFPTTEVFPSPSVGEGRRDRSLSGGVGGPVLAIMGLLGTGLLTAYMDSHFTTVMALVFALAFLIFVTRYLRHNRAEDAIFAAICLAGVPLTHPDTTIILMLGYVPWLLTIWLARERPTLRQWIALAVLIPAGALLMILPWVARILPLLGSGIASPFEIDPNHWRTLIAMHGGLIVPIALGGAVLALRRRAPLDLLMVGWLVFVLDFSTTGVLQRLAPGLLAPLLKYDYPFSIAWHGPIIPYAYLGARAVLWSLNRVGWARVRRWTDRLAWPALALGGAAVVLGLIFNGAILQMSKGVVGWYGAFASAADVQAMTWLREQTPPDARVLNFPGPQEGDWVPVISERDTVYFRPQPFFRHTEAAEAEQAALLAFWQNPADPAHADLLRAYGVDYVIVPQVVENPESFEALWRWQEPFAWGLAMASDVEDAPYLELVADFDGARVYQVVGEASSGGE